MWKPGELTARSWLKACPVADRLVADSRRILVVVAGMTAVTVADGWNAVIVADFGEIVVAVGTVAAPRKAP